MKPSHYTTPRMLREATLTGIGFTASSTASPFFFIAGLVIGIFLGALL